MTPDEMIEKLLDPSANTDNGSLVNDLLSEFWRGYPIENLRRLFTPATIGDAAFLVSELPQKVRPLLQEITGLLESDAPGIRGDAISALSQNTTFEDGWAAAKVVEGLADVHDGVRWMASKALRYMDGAALLSGLEHLARARSGTVWAQLKNAFLAIERHPKKAEASLQRLLAHEDVVARRFGATMATRPRLFIDPSFVSLCQSTGDPELMKIVNDATARPLPPWAEWEGK